MSPTIYSSKSSNGGYRTSVRVNAEPKIFGGEAASRRSSMTLVALPAIDHLNERALLDKKSKQAGASGLAKSSPDLSVWLSDGNQVNYERARQFVNYYCLRQGLGNPKISFTKQISRSKAGTFWEAVMTIGGGSMGIGKGSSKTTAQAQCYLDATAYIEKCDRQIWKEFAEAAKTGRSLGMVPKVKGMSLMMRFRNYATIVGPLMSSDYSAPDIHLTT